MAIESLDILLNEFIEAWNAGRRPDVDHYIERAPEAERDELAGLIGAFLEIAPTPEYSEAQLEQIRSDPAVQVVTKLVEGETGLWPSLLPRLRKRAKMTRKQVAAGLASALGLQGREEKIHFYYHQMESGTLDPAGVSHNVLAALSRIFGVRESELDASSSLMDFNVAATPEPLYTRTDEVMEDRLVHGVDAAPPSPPDMDEVDQLFRGGR